MKRAVCCLVSLLLLAAMAAGAGKALSKDEVIQLLTTGAEPRVITLVHQYGIDFGVDDAIERDVRAAGGGDRLIAALRDEAAKEAKKRLDLGDTFLQAGDLEGATAQYGQVINFDSKSAGAHIGMGKVYEQRGDSVAAQAEYQKAIESKPDSGAAYNALGAFWERKGEQKKGLEAYRSGLEAEPENADLKANYIRLAAKRTTQAAATQAHPKEEVTAASAPQADLVFKIVSASMDRSQLRSHEGADFDYEVEFSPRWGGKQLCVEVDTSGAVVLAQPPPAHLDVNSDGHASIKGKIRATQVASGTVVPFAVKLNVSDCATGQHFLAR